MSAAGPRVTVAVPAGALAEAISRRLRAAPGIVEPTVTALGEDGPSSDGAAPGAGIDLLVYRPGADRRRPLAPDLDSARAELGRLAALAPHRLVLLSSAAALDPHHHNPGYVGEDYRSAGKNPVARAWRELEALAAERLPDAERIVLRPASVAAAEGGDGVSALLGRRAAVTPPGYDPPLQLLDPHDLAEAVACAVERGAGRSGVYYVAPRGAVPARAALRLAGTRRLPLGWSGAGGERDYLRHDWTVSGARIERELGFVARWSSAQALAAAFGGGAGSTAAVAAGDGAGAEARGSGLLDGGASGFDDFGLDEGYIRRYERTLFRFLHDLWWRIEVRGTEHLPERGRAVLTGVHRGFMPWDGVMALVTVRRAVGRTPRFLVHPCLVKPPFLAPYMSKLGGIVACQENADRVLGAEGLLGMFPEGIHGAFTPYRKAYQLGRFGRDEYVKMALRNRAPILPFVTVGSAEIYPILGRLDWKWVKRATEWLYLPLCPNFPFPGLPLPSKWHTRFLEPMPVHERYGPEAADDRRVVTAISREVRAKMRAALDEMLARRRSIFWGSVFDGEAAEREPVRAGR